MALIGSDSERDMPRPPISRHRAFPAVVALWFAALLGFGSMVLPAVLLERGVALTGIARYVPAASPPLGLTARAAIALAAAVIGALLGLAIARRVARANESEQEDELESVSRVATFANGARRPIDATTELDSEGLAGDFGRPLTRRRALAMTEDYVAPFADADEPDPMPAYDEPASAPEADYAPPEPPYAAEADYESSEPLYTPEAAYTPFEPSPTDETGETWSGTEAVDPEDDAPTGTSQDFEPLPPEPQVEPPHEFGPAPDEPEADPLPFAAPSLTRRAIDPEPAARPQVNEPPQIVAAPAEGELVQLAQRLKTSLERRREEVARTSAPEPLPTSTADFEPAPADDAAQAMASYFSRPSTAASLSPYVAEEDEEDEVDEAEDGDEADSSYSSLLAMRGPYTPGASVRVRIEEPEADDELEPVEPVQPDEPADTDAALRAALAKLQRMSGSA